MKGMEDVEPGGEEREQEEPGKHFDPGEAASGGGGGELRDNVSSKEQPERSGGLVSVQRWWLVGWFVSSGSVGATLLVKEVNLHYGRRNSKIVKM